VDITAITGSFPQFFSPAMLPILAIALLAIIALSLLRNVIKSVLQVSLIVGVVVAATFFVSGAANATAGTEGVKNVISQVGKGVAESTGSPVDPTPYMDIQSTYQNIVNKLKEVQAISTAK
jgi:hypothetical protein